MDNKLHGFLTDDLREMASCSETWQLTLRAWTKHMRFLNITNNTLPSRSSPNRNIKASEKQISKPLYAERLQGKREIKIPASSCRWSAKALKLLTQAHYNGTHYYQWLHLLSALSLFLHGGSHQIEICKVSHHSLWLEMQLLVVVGSIPSTYQDPS